VIGNDVIDLFKSRNDSNWQRKGFLSKLFDDDEQLLIASSRDPEVTVWLLWSMKEAAYKIWNRETSIRTYCPKKFICSLSISVGQCIKGMVQLNGNVYYTKSYLSQDLIHTIAVDVPSNLDLVIEIIRTHVFKDSNGLPYCSLSKGEDVRPASISNHGRFERIVTIA